MKNPLLLLALAAVASGGCQSATNNSPQFDAGMTRMNVSVGFQSLDAEGIVYTSAAGGVPSLGDNVSQNATTGEITTVTLSGDYGLFVSDRVELGTHIGLGFGSTDDNTELASDFDGDGFLDRSLSATTTSIDETFFLLGGYSRYYFCECIGITPWLQADFGFAFGDWGGLYMGGSVGGSIFLDETSAIEARIYGQTLFDDDDKTGVGIEIGYSLFN